MGIDASTTCTGISIFNNKNLVYSTEIRAKSDEWHQRLIEQKDQIEEIIKKYEPIMAWGTRNISRSCGRRRATCRSPVPVRL